MKLRLRTRLTLTYCAVFLVLIAALEVGTYVSVQAAIHSIVDQELGTRLAGIEDHLSRHITKQPWAQLHQSLADHPAFHPDRFFLRRTNGTTLFAGRLLRPPAASEFSSVARVETLTASESAMRLLTVRRNIQGELYDLALGTDLQVPAAVLGQLWLLMLLSLPTVLFIASAGGYWIAGRALDPVSRIIQSAQFIDSSRLSQRVAVPDSGDEIALLAETMNGMLTRIEDGFRHVQQFTANASHELRTPMAIIRASAEIALLKSPASARDYQIALHRILREAERNSAMLNSMLSLARADARTELAAAEPVNLGGSLRRICDLIRPLADAKRVHLNLRIAADPTIHAGDEHLRRLWLILLDNAVKYSPVGGQVIVTVTLTPDGRPTCEVSNTGQGIAPEHLGKIFERFYRVDKSRNRADGGSGLGLAIAHQLASLYSAVIEVESEPGVETHFHVTFPRQSVVQSSALASAVAAS